MEVALSHKLLTLLMTVEMTKSLINKTWSSTYHGLVECSGHLIDVLHLFSPILYCIF